MTDETTSEQLADTSGRDIVRGLVLQVADLIEREEAEIEGQAADTPATEYTPPEGWRVLAVGEALREGDVTVRADGYQYPTERVGGWVGSNQRYIRPIEAEPQPEPQPESDTELQAQVAFLKGREVTLGTRLQQEKEVTTRLREELATQAETIRRLRVELDAAQQVPADSPELRQLRENLAEVIRERDQYRHCYDEVSSHLETIEKTAKAEAVEAIAEWLQPIRAAIAAADNVAESTRAGWLAEEVIQHLPKIMRHLTGLDSPEEIE